MKYRVYSEIQCERCKKMVYVVKLYENKLICLDCILETEKSYRDSLRFKQLKFIEETSLKRG